MKSSRFTRESVHGKPAEFVVSFLKTECRNFFGSEKVDFSTVKSKQVKLSLATEYELLRVSLSKAEAFFS